MGVLKDVYINADTTKTIKAGINSLLDIIQVLRLFQDLFSISPPAVAHPLKKKKTPNTNRKIRIARSYKLKCFLSHNVLCFRGRGDKEQMPVQDCFSEIIEDVVVGTQGAIFFHEGHVSGICYGSVFRPVGIRHK